MWVVVDGGGTKADWGWWKEEEISLVSTIGCNPNAGKPTEWEGLLAKENLPFKEAKKLYYYGAGCGNPENNRKIGQVIRRLFPSAEVFISNDLMGAAKAVFGEQPGVISILGTGTNSAVYDGARFIDQLPSLGYILGDEGGGCHLGKMLLKAFLHRQLPTSLEEALLQFEPGIKNQFIQRVYADPLPNAWLARLAQFCKQYESETEIKRLIEVNFQTFIDQLLIYPKTKQLPLGFVGGMAFHFADHLQRILEKNGLAEAKILDKPLPALIEFHRKRSISP